MINWTTLKNIRLNNNENNEQIEQYVTTITQQVQQLIQAIALAPQSQAQNQQRESNVVPLPTFLGGNQDPIKWLESIGCAFEANNIQGQRRLAVVGAYL